MRIAKLILRNWGPFRGEHELNLGARAYAVVAQHVGDAERSNWGGKTMLLEAVDFVLTGRHRHRTEDDIITTGEVECAVTIVFDDETVASRYRKRGSATRLEYGASTRDEAKAALEARLALTPEDFSNTAYFEQKRMARLIVARPEERMAIVGGWLRLDRLEKAEDHVRAKLAGIALQRAAVDTRRAAMQDATSRALGDHADSAALDAALADTATKLTEGRARLAAMQDELELVRAQQLTRQRAAEYAALVEEGKSLKATADHDMAALEAANLDARQVERDAAGKASIAGAETARRRSLARGRFDGACPVAGIACPAVDDINARSRQNASRLAEAESIEAAAKVALEGAQRQERTFAAKHQAALRLEERLEGLRAQALRLRPEHVAAKALTKVVDADALRTSISALQDRLNHLAGEVGRLTAAVHDVNANTRASAAASQTLATLTAASEVHRAALGILGRNGAQRRLAEGALATIGDGANNLLTACGVDLSVALSWAREGQGLAKHCAECGAPFPTSAKVKTCLTCGAIRGPLLVQRLEVELSDRSGAAEDFAGIALQLSASAWLRRERGSDWGTLLLDEPTGAMDRAHRRRFTSHLATMLARSQVEQALVVAHDPAVLEALPGRIQIMRDGSWSTARVVA
jgi:DNA repair exonuclease SbcCD ATPase subunit